MGTIKKLFWAIFGFAVVGAIFLYPLIGFTFVVLIGISLSILHSEDSPKTWALKRILWISIGIVFVVLLYKYQSKPYGGDCDDLDGLKVADLNLVPDDYTGMALVCEGDKVRSLANYKDGKKEGVSKIWYPNGQLKFKENYKDGKGDGIQRWWHDNGHLVVKLNYKDGKKIDDKVVYYYEDGTIYKTNYYENGSLDKIDYFYYHDYSGATRTDYYENGSLDKAVYYTEDGADKKTEYYEDGKITRCEGDCD